MSTPSIDEQMLIRFRRAVLSARTLQNTANNSIATRTPVQQQSSSAAAAVDNPIKGARIPPPPPLDELAHLQFAMSLVDIGHRHVVAKNDQHILSSSSSSMKMGSKRSKSIHRVHEMDMIHYEMRAKHVESVVPLSRAVIHSIVDPFSKRVKKSRILQPEQHRQHRQMERPVTMKDVMQSDPLFGALFTRRPLIESRILSKTHALQTDGVEDMGEAFDRELNNISDAEPYKQVARQPAIPVSRERSARRIVRQLNSMACNNYSSPVLGENGNGGETRHTQNISDDDSSGDERHKLGFTTASKMLNSSMKNRHGSGSNDGNYVSHSRKRRNGHFSRQGPYHPAKQVVSLMGAEDDNDEQDDDESYNSGSGPRKRAKFVSPLYKKSQGSDNSDTQKKDRDSNSRSRKRKAKTGKDGDDDAAPDDVGRHFEEGEIPEELRDLDPRLIENIMCEVLQSKSNVSFDDIAGLSDVKKNIQEMVIWPMSRPDLFRGNRQPPRCVMLFGPPGTGKTMIAKAVAHHIHSKFFNISASSLMSKWVGEGERLVKTLFRLARYFGRSVIFIDEIDSLLSKRTEGDMDSGVRRIKTEFLVGLDGAGTDKDKDQILFIGATNLPWEIDEAVRRRFAKKIMVPLPDDVARANMVKQMKQKGDEKYDLSQDDIETIVRETEGYSGSDMHNLCKEAVMNPLRELMQSIDDYTKIDTVDKDDIQPVRLHDFHVAMRHIRASVGVEDVKKFEDWNKDHGSTAGW